MTDQPAPAGLTVEEKLRGEIALAMDNTLNADWSVDSVGRTGAFLTSISKERALNKVMRLITEHVCSVLEAERGKAIDPQVLYKEAAASWSEVMPNCDDGSRRNAYIAGYSNARNTEAQNRTLTEKLDKAVEGLKKIKLAGRRWVAFGFTLTDEAEVARSTLAAIEGEGQ